MKKPEILFLRRNEKFTIKGKILEIEEKELYYCITFKIIDVLNEENIFFEIEHLRGTYYNKENNIKNFSKEEIVYITGRFTRKIERRTNVETKQRETWNIMSTEIETLQKEELINKTIKNKPIEEKKEDKKEEIKKEKININFNFNIKEEEIINDTIEDDELNEKKEKVYKKIVKAFD